MWYVVVGAVWFMGVLEGAVDSGLRGVRVSPCSLGMCYVQIDLAASRMSC